MDATDLRIFTRLVESPFLTDERLGREVGLTGKAARLRRQRLEGAGVLAEYALHPTAPTLGRYAQTWRYRARGSLELPVPRLQEIEDLVLVRSFRPDLHVALRYARTPEPEPDPRLDGILGQPLSGWGEAAADALPDRRPLSRTDWRVIEAVVQSPRSTQASWCRAARVSPRTFRRRLGRLEAEGLLDHSVILDLRHEGGLAAYGVWLRVTPEFDERELQSIHLWDRPHWTGDPRGVYLLGCADNYSQAREIELRLGALPGVESAEPLIPAGGFFARERILGWVHEQLTVGSALELETRRSPDERARPLPSSPNRIGPSVVRRSSSIARSSGTSGSPRGGRRRKSSVSPASLGRGPG